MKKENWMYLAATSMMVLSFVGLGILEYFRTNHMDWYNSLHVWGGVVALLGTTAWLLLVAVTFIYIYDQGSNNV